MQIAILQLISFDTPGYQNAQPSMKSLQLAERSYQEYVFKLTFPTRILKAPWQYWLYPPPPANTHETHLTPHTHNCHSLQPTHVRLTLKKCYKTKIEINLKCTHNCSRVIQWEHRLVIFLYEVFRGTKRAWHSTCINFWYESDTQLSFVLLKNPPSSLILVFA